MCQFVVVYFRHGLKIGRKRLGRKMTPSVRPSCLLSIKVLSFVILIITTVHLKCGMKIWNTVRDEVVDGL